MRQLSDILIEKSKEVGGHAALGRMLGGLTGQAIGQYIKGAGMPSFTTALKWKEVFNENLIELMFLGDETTINPNDQIASMKREIKAMDMAFESQNKLITTLKQELDECRSRNNQVHVMKK